MTFRELVTKWTFETKGEDKLHGIESRLDAIKNRLNFLAGAEAVKGLYELTEKFAKWGEELHMSSAAAGIAVEDFQKLSYSATQAGVSQEELGISLKMLNRHLYAARQGGEAAQKVFRDLHVDPSKFKTAQDAMLGIADATKSIHDPIKKASILSQAFGRSGARLAVWMNEGSAAIRAQADEAERLGIVVSSDKIEKLVAVEHAFSRLWAVVKGFAANIAASIAPVIEHLIGRFIEFLAANRELIQNNIQSWLMKLAFGLGFIWGLMEIGIALFYKFAKAIGMQDNILTLVSGFVGLIGTLFMFHKAVGAVTSVVGTLKSVWSAYGTVKKWIMALEEAQLASFGLWVVAIGGIIVAVHDIWALLHGAKFEDTWLGKGLGFIGKMLEGLGLLKDGLSIQKFIGGGIGDAAYNAYEWTKDTMNRGVDFSAGGYSGIASGPQLSGGTNIAGGDTHVSIDAPMNFTVPAGTPVKEMAPMIVDQIKGHFGEQMRAAKRTLTPLVQQ